MVTEIVHNARPFDQRFTDRLRVGTFGQVPNMLAERGAGYRTIGSSSFNGEKNYGELGPIKSYIPDYNALRARSWQLYYESEVAQIVINKYVVWVIGQGLKVQSEPETDVLKDMGISVNKQQFSKKIESYFKLYCKSRMSDYSDMRNLNMIESDGFKNAIIGGDVLVILRFIDDTVKVQIVDGEHVQSPMFGSEFSPKELQNGNRIIHGIEIDKRGKHVAYYIRKDYRSLEYERIPARGSDSDALMSFMVYGSNYRIDNYRGMPLLSVMFETAKKLERYKEATVGSAEERQKIAYAFQHKEFSTGENPLAKQTVKARDIDYAYSDGFVPRDAYGKALADEFALSTNKQTINLPIGAELKLLESKNELYFKDFYETNIMLFCAAAQIPYEVAMSRYDSNYSASRGAIKDWEHILNVRRGIFGFQFKQPIYDFWLEAQILLGIISAPGYIKARVMNNRIALEAFRNARWVGAPVPHIDPVKEVEAERLKLGNEKIPLTTVEAATEALGGGDSSANAEQFADEYKKAKALGIKVDEPKVEKPGAPTKSAAKKKPAK